MVHTAFMHANRREQPCYSQREDVYLFHRYILNMLQIICEIRKYENVG